MDVSGYELSQNQLSEAQSQSNQKSIINQKMSKHNRKLYKVIAFAVPLILRLTSAQTMTPSHLGGRLNYSPQMPTTTEHVALDHHADSGTDLILGYTNDRFMCLNENQLVQPLNSYQIDNKNEKFKSSHIPGNYGVYVQLVQESDSGNSKGLYFLDFNETPMEQDLRPISIAILDDPRGVLASHPDKWVNIKGGENLENTIYFAVMTVSYISLMKATLSGDYNQPHTIEVFRTVSISNPQPELEIAKNAHVLSFRIASGNYGSPQNDSPVVYFLHSYEVPEYHSGFIANKGFHVSAFVADHKEGTTPDNKIVNVDQAYTLIASSSDSFTWGNVGDLDVLQVGGHFNQGGSFKSGFVSISIDPDGLPSSVLAYTTLDYSTNESKNPFTAITVLFWSDDTGNGVGSVYSETGDLVFFVTYENKTKYKELRVATEGATKVKWRPLDLKAKVIDDENKIGKIYGLFTGKDRDSEGNERDDNYIFLGFEGNFDFNSMTWQNGPPGTYLHMFSIVDGPDTFEQTSEWVRHQNAAKIRLYDSALGFSFVETGNLNNYKENQSAVKFKVINDEISPNMFSTLFSSNNAQTSPVALDPTKMRYAFDSLSVGDENNLVDGTQSDFIVSNSVLTESQTSIIHSYPIRVYMPNQYQSPCLLTSFDGIELSFEYDVYEIDLTTLYSPMILPYDISTGPTIPLTFTFNQGAVTPQGTCSFASDDIKFGYSFMFGDQTAGFRPLEDDDCSQYPYEDSQSEACQFNRAAYHLMNTPSRTFTEISSDKVLQFDFQLTHQDFPILNETAELLGYFYYYTEGYGEMLEVPFVHLSFNHKHAQFQAQLPPELLIRDMDPQIEVSIGRPQIDSLIDLVIDVSTHIASDDASEGCQECLIDYNPQNYVFTIDSGLVCLDQCQVIPQVSRVSLDSDLYRAKFYKTLPIVITLSSSEAPGMEPVELETSMKIDIEVEFDQETLERLALDGQLAQILEQYEDDIENAVVEEVGTGEVVEEPVVEEVPVKPTNDTLPRKDDVETKQNGKVAEAPLSVDAYKELTSFDAASFFEGKLSNEEKSRLGATDNKILQNSILGELYSVPSFKSLDKFGRAKIKMSSKVKDSSFPTDSRRLKAKGGLFSDTLQVSERAEQLDLDLKATDSLKIEMVPGTIDYIEKLGFTWQVVSMDDDEMMIDFTFENSNYVTADEDLPDVLIISFENTQYYLQPQSDDKKNIEDGFRITIDVPVQMDKSSQGDQAAAASSMNSIVMGNLVVGFFLQAALQTIFASINSLQITAHIPLFNFKLPGNVYFIFDILIVIVAFDFLPVTEYVDLNFTQTDAWNDKFIWLGYDSANFVELLGSIIIFIVFFALKAILILTRVCSSCEGKFKCLTNFLDSTAFKQALIRFMLETLFELVICGLLSVKMLEVREIWTVSDTIAFILAMVMLFFSFIFMIIALRFLLCKQLKYSKIRQKESMDRRIATYKKNQEEKKRIEEEAEEKAKEKSSLSKSTPKKKTKLSARNHKKPEPKSQEIVSLVASQVTLIEEKQCEVYEPLFENLQIEKPSIVLFNLQFILRRIVLIMTAMYLSEQAWLQLMVFIVTSQYCSIYLVYCMPFDTANQNGLELFNEVMTMLLGISCMIILGYGVTVEAQLIQGNFLTWLLYIKLGFNGVIIIGTLLKLLLGAFKKCWHKCKRKDVIQKQKAKKAAMPKKNFKIVNGKRVYFKRKRTQKISKFPRSPITVDDDQDNSILRDNPSMRQMVPPDLTAKPDQVVDIDSNDSINLFNQAYGDEANQNDPKVQVTQEDYRAQRSHRRMESLRAIGNALTNDIKMIEQNLDSQLRGNPSTFHSTTPRNLSYDRASDETALRDPVSSFVQPKSVKKTKKGAQKSSKRKRDPPARLPTVKEEVSEGSSGIKANRAKNNRINTFGQ